MSRRKRIRPFHEYLVIIITIAIIFLEFFILRPTMVDGISMRPSLDDGDIVLMNTLDKDFKRGDFIIFDYSVYLDDKLDEGKAVKRVIGLPGDKVLLNGQGVFVNGIEMFSDIKHDASEYSITVPENHYFVLGDNRLVSVDSRMMGPIDKKAVIGKGHFILNKFEKTN